MKKKDILMRKSQKCHPELVSGSFEISYLAYTKDSEINSEGQIYTFSIFETDS